MDKSSRRSFLESAAIAGLGASSLFGVGVATGHALGDTAAPGGTPLNLAPPPNGYAAEATRMTRATIGRFWDPKVRMFKATVMSAEAVPSDAAHNLGYVFWPSQIALHSLVEGAKTDPAEYAPQVWQIYGGLEKYFNGGMHAYNAWLYSPGNHDAYYDDNVWAVITLAEAYRALRKTEPAHATVYLNRATDIMANFIHGGWDDTGKPGGERWGTDPTKSGTADKTVSATAGAALAALTLARAGRNASFNIAWGASALSWIWTRLRDTDGLILDGLKAPNWAVMTTKWTYNTGVTMRAYVEHYRLTKDPESLKKAAQLAAAALNHTSRLYDGLVSDPGKRCFYDHTYFVHFLLDGLLQVSQATPDRHLARAIARECRREANYAYNYIRDDADNFYWRNWRLWCIGPEQLARWERFTGQTATLQTDAAEQSSDRSRWVKTLLANASASRLFWIAARF